MKPEANRDANGGVLLRGREITRRWGDVIRRYGYEEQAG